LQILYHKTVSFSNDVFRFAQNDVVPADSNDAMFAQCAVRHTSLGEAVIIGEANIICRRQTSFKKRIFVLVVQKVRFLLVRTMGLPPVAALADEQLSTVRSYGQIAVGFSLFQVPS